MSWIPIKSGQTARRETQPGESGWHKFSIPTNQHGTCQGGPIKGNWSSRAPLCQVPCKAGQRVPTMETCPPLSPGCGSKSCNWGYANFSLPVHLPGFHFVEPRLFWKKFLVSHAHRVRQPKESLRQLSLGPERDQRARSGRPKRKGPERTWLPFSAHGLAIWKC